MTQASPSRKLALQLQAAHRRTSAYSFSSLEAVSSSEIDKPISLRALPRWPSRRERFSKHICSSQCRSCQRFEMGQRSLVIEKRLRIFELQVEKISEVREHMRELVLT